MIAYRESLKSLIDGYQKSIDDLIDSGIYDSSDNFTVVVQPFMKKV